jgi:hypothetical protein
MSSIFPALGLASEWIAAQIRKPFEIAEIIAALTA